MIKLSEKGVFLASNNEIIAEEHFTGEIKKEEAQTINGIDGYF